MKVLISTSEVSLSASNPYLDPDNHINLKKLKSLDDKITKAQEAYLANAEKNDEKPNEKVKVTYSIKRKAKPVQYSKGSDKKGDLKYLAKRAIKVFKAKRLSDKGYITKEPILEVYEATYDKFKSDIKQAEAALSIHMRSADKTKASVAKQKTKLKEAADKDFTKAMTQLQTILEAGGVKPTDMVASTGMGGTTALLKVGEYVVSIGKSDMAKFKAAKKAASEAQ